MKNISKETSAFGNQIWGSFDTGWEKAVIAGALVSLACEILLNFLGIGLGLTSFNIHDSEVSTLEPIIIMWLSFTGVISMAAGGWFVGKFSNTPSKITRGCYGIVAWSIATLVTISMVFSSSSDFIGGILEIAKNNMYAFQSIISKGNDLISTNLQSNLSRNSQYVTKIKNYTGSASLVIFMAFFMSGIASFLGAIYGGRVNILETDE